ncbi:MAG: nicotinate-nucleotide--dimethylbenzimidazole phosphoribosyltransferase [Prevotellaceae bacterium]|nr:nicotinate-nucleotide--dimethylbenzimidazole phosphoribosyltransferase [Prevotellaceae bacterium]MDY6130651.1 nicotinate-nucleotide--dimethylbenzimidazole phosphoribosyltransferase [Prevotella sp.]
MRIFDIRKPNENIKEAILQKIDNLNKPKGSLGRLETLAMQICLIQQSLTPQLIHPCHLLFGGDHGIEREGVSVSPRDVTWQQMYNFTKGGGGVNMFCRQHHFDLRIIDMGVDHDLTDNKDIINRKIARGTKNFLQEAAMSHEEFKKAIEIGADMAEKCHGEGCTIICMGEMGIANTSPSSVWMSLFGNIPLNECIGVGSGLDSPGVQHKKEILGKAVEHFKATAQDMELDVEHLHEAYGQTNENILYAIRYFSGFEMAGTIGAMLRAAELGMMIMVDGFIMSACMLAASRLCPEILHYAIFGHSGDESGHSRMLQIMRAKPLLQLGLRLGEGTGALCSYPIIESAVRMVNEMNNFENAKITKYF